ncbi:ceramide-1-phosphate transfer protein-like isoform X2 [Phyllopteryx taeniolatus]|uniref:ceramide-1-phosphate transfer protein-like isoform X2 n=1 Tax=Phyllopteryx taeniolatus TaxID=161469 RepID=UPI002AD36DCE|nr:ceramide-1-phosphate transfer protein-like isoform X2 [Phyllopteryx taeniolatus]
MPRPIVSGLASAALFDVQPLRCRRCPAGAVPAELGSADHVRADHTARCDRGLSTLSSVGSFMESLGPVVSFFSQKVKEKLELIRRLAGTPGPKRAAYRSVRSMAEVEIRAGVVDFTRRTDSGCRTLLRLHRSLLWLAMTLDGLTHAPDRHGRLKTPGELSSDAYQVALAPHHPWVLRQAAELVFVALPDREHFLRLVCAQNQPEAEPVLRVISRALEKVHGATQRILEEHAMLDLP